MPINPPLRPEDITPEHLMAFADGALEDADMDAVAALVDQSPHLQDELAAYLTSRDALAGAYDPVLDTPVPDHLVRLVLGESAPEATGDPAGVISLDAERTRRLALTNTSVWWQAMAACAMLAIGGVIGSGLASQSPPDGSAQLTFAGTLDAGSPLARALDNAPSASVISVKAGSVKPIQTFITQAGIVCREYEAGRPGNGVVGIACRSGDTWRVETLVTITNPASPTGETLMPASGLDLGVLDSALDGLGAGAGLEADAEACLRQAGWQVDACAKFFTGPE